jgi:hypothetical protein
MSESQQRRIETYATLALALLGIGGVALAIGADRERLAAAEVRVATVDTAQKADHDILLDMRAQVNDMHEWLKASRSAPSSVTSRVSP